jgi:regulation of enolase protein 1 (concanavalin A-like superfamily)
MKKSLSTAVLVLLGVWVQANAQDLGSVATNIELTAITFDLALNGAQDHVKINAGALALTSPPKRDNFRDPDGKLSNNTAPMLLSKVDNAQPFTLIAKVTPTFLDTYDAGALYIWVRDDLWLKMAMERDERGKTRLVTVRTTGTSDDNNHDVVTARSVYMKISSDTKTVGFYYSLDKKEWQLMKLFKNEYPQTIWLGVSSQSPVGNGNTSLFEEVTLTRASIADFRLGV